MYSVKKASSKAEIAASGHVEDVSAGVLDAMVDKGILTAASKKTAVCLML